MRLLIKSAYFLLYGIEFTTLFLCSYLTVVLIGLSIPLNSDYNPEEGSVEIFVISNGVHTDVCLPVQSDLIDWSNFIDTAPYEGIYRKPKFISMGWGDKRFFLNTPTWSDLTISTALNAAFVPSSTAMHVTYYEEQPIENEQVKRCVITKKKYKKLIRFIKASFSLDKQSFPSIIPNAGYGKVDNFYDAKGSFHLFRTCNIWTNDALAIAGVKTSILALIDKGILRHL